MRIMRIMGINDMGYVQRLSKTRKCGLVSTATAGCGAGVQNVVEARKVKNIVLKDYLTTRSGLIKPKNVLFNDTLKPRSGCLPRLREAWRGSRMSVAGVQNIRRQVSKMRVELS